MKYKRSKFILIFFILFILIFIFMDNMFAKKKHSSNNYKSYKRAKIIDGDTFKYNNKRYRIQQYNAPEIGKPGWKKSTKKLQNKIDSGNYEWKPVAKDKYGRTIVKEKKVKNKKR